MSCSKCDMHRKHQRPLNMCSLEEGTTYLVRTADLYDMCSLSSFARLRLVISKILRRFVKSYSSCEETVNALLIHTPERIVSFCQSVYISMKIILISKVCDPLRASHTTYCFPPTC